MDLKSRFFFHKEGIPQKTLYKLPDKILRGFIFPEQMLKLAPMKFSRSFGFFMQAKLKYNWTNEKLTEKEVRIARDISQMLLFGSEIKNIKSKLKKINQKAFL